MHNAEIEGRAIGKTPDLVAVPFLQAKENGLRYAETTGGCSVWKRNPEQVDLLRFEARVAKGQLGSMEF